MIFLSAGLFYVNTILIILIITPFQKNKYNYIKSNMRYVKKDTIELISFII